MDWFIRMSKQLLRVEHVGQHLDFTRGEHR